MNLGDTVCPEKGASQVKSEPIFNIHSGQGVRAVTCYAVGDVFESCRIFKDFGI
jgi:hypothetical protein